MYLLAGIGHQSYCMELAAMTRVSTSGRSAVFSGNYLTVLRYSPARAISSSWSVSSVSSGPPTRRCGRGWRHCRTIIRSHSPSSLRFRSSRSCRTRRPTPSTFWRSSSCTLRRIESAPEPRWFTCTSSETRCRLTTRSCRFPRANGEPGLCSRGGSGSTDTTSMWTCRWNRRLSTRRSWHRTPLYTPHLRRNSSTFILPPNFLLNILFSIY